MNILSKEKILNKHFLLGTAFVILTMCTIYIYFLYTKFYPSTDNAYVKANIIDMSLKVGGYIDHIYVHDNEFVHKGTLLLTLNPIDYSLNVAKAEQALKGQKNELTFAKLQIEKALSAQTKAQADHTFANQMESRYSKLYQSKAGSLQDLQKYTNQAHQMKQLFDDANIALKQAHVQYEIAKTKLQAAKIGLRDAKLNDSYTKLYAPTDGYVSHLNLHAGQLIAAGQKLFGFVDNADWWIEVNFKEKEISRIQPGQPAEIELDMYSHQYLGTVQSISHASGSTFVLLPPENASGNWVKVAQYFTVRVTVKNQPAYPLRVGASADVSINTRKH